MNFILNRLVRSNITVIIELIEKSQSLVSRSGWSIQCEFKLLQPSLDTGLNRGVAITMLTNARHTSPWYISALADRLKPLAHSHSLVF